MSTYNPIDVADALEAMGLGEAIDRMCDRFLLLPALSKKELLEALRSASVGNRDQNRLVKLLGSSAGVSCPRYVLRAVKYSMTMSLCWH